MWAGMDFTELHFDLTPSVLDEQKWLVAGLDLCAESGMHVIGSEAVNLRRTPDCR